MIAPASSIAAVPDDLDFADAAPLLCAGITTFNALRNSGARPGDLVAILGIGGLGHLGVQYASKMGFRTVAIARGADKARLARELGAAHYDALRVGGSDRRLLRIELRIDEPVAVEIERVAPVVVDPGLVVVVEAVLALRVLEHWCHNGSLTVSFRVCTQLVPSQRNTYAEPESMPRSSSRYAPTMATPPGMATDVPNSSPPAPSERRSSNSALEACGSRTRTANSAETAQRRKRVSVADASTERLVRVRPDAALVCTDGVQALLRDAVGSVRREAVRRDAAGPGCRLQDFDWPEGARQSLEARERRHARDFVAPSAVRRS
jgi:hypothetical protein